MRAVAKRLVLRGAAAAQRVVLGGSAVAELYAHKLDAARDRVRAVIGHGHHRRALLGPRFDAVDRIAQRPGGTFLDRGDDLPHLGAVRIDPGLRVLAKHGLQAVGAVARVGADAAIVENRDGLADIAHAFVLAGIRGIPVAESDRAMCSVAERLVLRLPAAAQRDGTHRGTGFARGAPQIRHRLGLHVLQQAIRAVRRPADLRSGGQNVWVSEGRPSATRPYVVACPSHIIEMCAFAAFKSRKARCRGWSSYKPVAPADLKITSIARWHIWAAKAPLRRHVALVIRSGASPRSAMACAEAQSLRSTNRAVSMQADASATFICTAAMSARPLPE